MPKKILVVFFALYAVTNFFNLGKLDFSYKEAKNAIISLQLNTSGNYKWQTILGKPYFKKPPLIAYYTSILFKIFGNSEFIARAGQFVFILLIAFLPFFLKEFNILDPPYFAFIFLTTAIVLMSINFYSTYAACVFFLFLALYKAYFEQKGFSIYLVLAFLTQGLFALFLFYFILLGFVVFEKKPGLIDNKEHLMGLALILILSLCGIVLYDFNIQSIHYLVGSLFLGFWESFSFKNYILHLIIFPFKLFLLFLPWSMFSKQLIKKQESKLYNFAFFGTILTVFLLWLVPVHNYLIIAPFFALWLSLFKLELNSFYLKIIILLGVFTILSAELFGYLFVKTSNYLSLLIFLAFVVIFIKVSSKQYKIEQYLYIVALMICLKASYSMIAIPYKASYLPDVSAYGQKIANIILKNKAKYVMSNNVHLDLLYYVEKTSNLPINIPQKGKGVLITQDKDIFKKVYGSEFSPYGVFFVGEY
ncbi:Polymyxin resistance protein ArnT [Desulfurella amilsii]|uniref:Polymyxin resistance protein ArnT n=1 Tax=Desulfurella amilsii TaxID=1562698 RepID=A0A1X4XXI1_9BACT|nr:glycosyltransferase family 39 protein [Desulfurella amilsii]OSS42251.1 Polymyxin resistance protein ArnT [Desulfurella amilsii]